jgi:phosphoribosylaminoimidazolecarboxamide formyltransferase/IMP cyclohydrolase
VSAIVAGISRGRGKYARVNANRVTRALLSVSDKTGLVELGRGLQKAGVDILSTGGTARTLREAGILVKEVSEFTGAPEILDGRVKTLHPRVAGGILGRPTDAHRAEMRAHGLDAIDLVVVNLYPFREAVAAGKPFEDVIENIDIGGPTMIRAAAKNFERVGVVVDPADYGRVLAALAATGALDEQLRFELARKAFAHTAAYDGAIAGHLGRITTRGGAPGDFSVTMHPTLHLERVLRYGENPHQKAAFYSVEGSRRPSLARAEVLQGKELSYNNLLDLDAAMKLAGEFAQPAAVIIKHTNPAGAAVADGEGEGALLEAYRRARETDPVSAFGGIVAVNRRVDGALAKEMGELFLECIIAPDYTDEAKAQLAAKKNLRLLKGPVGPVEPGELELRSLAGSLLVQSRDAAIAAVADAKVVSKRAPTAAELADLEFAWRVSKHVKSNAIVFARGGRTIGVGAGQMSRVDSVRLAISKARSSLQGAVVASDAFFPFRDGLDEAVKAGVTALVEPGGSVRDAEVVAAADEHGVALVFTGERHFRH